MAAFNRCRDNAQRLTEKTFATIVVIDIDHDRTEAGWVQYRLTTVLIPVFPGRFEKFDRLYMIEVAEFVGVFLFYGDKGFSFYGWVSSCGLLSITVVLVTAELFGAL